MSFFTTPLSQLSIAHLQELLDLKAVENSLLEFKREIPSKDETLKKLSSFANTFGGFMVIGAQASSEGRIEALCGVDPIPVPAQNGRFCYVIYTPEVQGRRLRPASEISPNWLEVRVARPGLLAVSALELQSLT